MGQSPNKITRLGGLRRAAETQKAFVKDNETVEAEALEDAEAGVTVTEVPRDVAMPWEAGPTVTVAGPRDVTEPRESVTEQEAASEQEAAIELEAATELDEASELEEARERTMT